MRVRRCAVLFFESREDVGFDLESLLAGGAGLSRTSRWLAMAPHLDNEIEIDAAQRELLGALSPGMWVDSGTLPPHRADTFESLLREGLVIADDGRHVDQRERDEAIRAANWWSLAALFHRQGRWHGVDGVQAMEESGLLTATGLRKRFGPPPAHIGERADASQRLPLPRAPSSDFDGLLARRATCRNFDDRPLSRELFAQMLQRVFSAQAQVRVSDDTVFLKKTSPSGGGLHSTEAYLVVQNVEGFAPGLYHYHPVDHALEPLPPPELPLAEFVRLALAGQHWFANAPVLAVLTPRFGRSFWKYRHHAKAYRALVLDSGHLSQTLYLSATELGLGAFVTSAINEVDIERGFGLDPLVEGPLAICGFGWRAPSMETTEFDPAGTVWESRPEP
ncbi:dehydrogenase [Lysobacter concretionis Ko07 = DSM 16239]|uniref:Dehydrogenase n=1 Tax=Lysobacter concretionis Ko07 = DSM 16239 TaxID=1122185 RepID=A0A0A0EMA7_9GAMM|nr:MULTISPECIES: putative peptide maturation dehydrogenase [Lysobacter]KGM51258.1 dehydrogenase [Lysobacter concretionis Ko07 = DSM 16239]QOD90962.1 putative peptide maturation dehydrogenase [Lysobacter sp. CW239]